MWNKVTYTEYRREEFLSPQYSQKWPFPMELVYFFLFVNSPARNDVLTLVITI